MATGSLTIVGSGIKFAAHLTLETQALIEQAEKLFFLVNDPATAGWIQELNPTAESLAPFYNQKKPRLQSYKEMVGHILVEVRRGVRVCALFYGHPGVLVTPAQEAIRQARREGFQVSMLPGVSAEDCLFADLALDPAYHGCQSFDATDFLLRQRRFDPTSNLILWQVGVTGQLYPGKGDIGTTGIRILTDHLLGHYDAEHKVTLYEAAQMPAFEPRIDRLPLCRLPDANVTTVSTLYIPPATEAPWDTEIMNRLGITPSNLLWDEV